MHTNESELANVNLSLHFASGRHKDILTKLDGCTIRSQKFMLDRLSSLSILVSA